MHTVAEAIVNGTAGEVGDHVHEIAAVALRQDQEAREQPHAGEQDAADLQHSHDLVTRSAVLSIVLGEDGIVGRHAQGYVAVAHGLDLAASLPHHPAAGVLAQDLGHRP